MKIKMKGKEGKLYATGIVTVELKASPKAKYIASITQVIPTKIYCLVLRRNLSTSNLR